MIKVDVIIPEELSKLDGNTKKAIKKSLYDSTDFVRNDAVRRAPVHTGTLRRSITTVVRNNVGVVGTNLKYAAIHEFGGIIKARRKPYLVFKYKGKRIRKKSVRIRKKPYLRPALEKNIKAIQNIFKKNFDSLLIQ